jgi:hypothetical protein
MCVTAGGTSCDPTRFTGRSRQSAIEGHSALRDNEGVSSDNPFVKSLVNLRAIIGQNPLSHAHARIPQLHNTVAGVTRIYINRADNHVSDSSLEYGICARTSASPCGTRLQSDIKRGASRHPCAKIAEAFNLGMIAARSSMMALRHDSIVDDEDRANRGIRAGLTKRFLCFVECRAHELFVSFSIHRFDRCIVVLAKRSNAALPPRHRRIGRDTRDTALAIMKEVFSADPKAFALSQVALQYS